MMEKHRSLGRRFLIKTCKVVLAGAFCIGLLSSFQIAKAQNPSNIDAFKKFVEVGNYGDASFYINNGLIDKDRLDTSQMFYDVFIGEHYDNLQKNAEKINGLYTYLNEIKPIDLNRTVNCYRNKDRSCLLVNALFSGAQRDAIAYFADRGLDLNQRSNGVPPATIPLFLRLGSTYKLDDLNFLVSRGLVIGDELYPIEELVNFQNNDVYRQGLTMPGNYLTLRDQNFLDMLVIVLGSQTRMRYPEKSLHKNALCEFIAYAAPSFSPSFDYLEFTLVNNREFRGKNIGLQQRSGQSVYEPFPQACVSLIQTMASSHAQLDKVISLFASQGDVETANWLISIKRDSS